LKTRRNAVLAGLVAGAILVIGIVETPASSAPQSRAADAQEPTDLDRLSDLVLRLDELRLDGADDIILADARDKIAAELRLDVSEGAPSAGADTVAAESNVADARGRAADDTSAAAQLRRHAQTDLRTKARAAAILTLKRELVGDLRLLQLRIDAGTDDTPALAAQQDQMLNEYLKLTREEIRLGVREIQGSGPESPGDRR
jgi:hypothetical protein